MPDRALVTTELARLLGVLAHPQRLRIVEELRASELDVNTLQGILNISHSRVSQQLALLRTSRMVAERREGRHVYYHLVQPELAHWLLEGLRFVEGRVSDADAIRDALDHVRQIWSAPGPSNANP